MKTVLCRAVRVSVDNSPGGYGRAVPPDVVELEEELAKVLIKDGQFEKVTLPKKSTYIARVDQPEETKIVTPEMTVAIEPVKLDKRFKSNK